MGFKRFQKETLTLLAKEWLFFTALTGLIVTWAILGHPPSTGWRDYEPIFLLWGLFVSIRGIERSHALCHAGRFMERMPAPGLSLVVLGFVLGMLMTIDVALVTLVPLIFAMGLSQRVRILLLASFAAHAGAALLPFGTPQNLFIFYYFHPTVIDFVKAIAPLSFSLLLLFLIVGAFSGVRRKVPEDRPEPKPLCKGSAIIYLLFFALVVGTVLGFLPLAVVLLPLLYAWAFDTETLKVDYFLLFTFVVFLALAANIRELLMPWVHTGHHIFLLSTMMSQIISNVPTTLLLEPVTTHWRSLLWGTNVGGFGTPIAALANLILIRLYRIHAGSDGGFTKRFLLANLPVVAAGIGLYFAVRYL